MSLLDDVSIVVTPNGYKAGELYAVIPVPTEGAEEVTNGDFATNSGWSEGGGATISGGQANIDGDGTSFASITQSNVFTEGKRYKVTADVIITSGLGLKFQDGANNENIGFATTTGSYEFYFIATSNTSFVIGRRTGGTAFDSSVDNVSVKEYTSADMDVTRATAATRVDENGLVNYAEVLGVEEITNGDFATNLDSWSTSSWWVWNSLGAYHPSTSSHKPLYQQCCVIGKTYLITFDLNCVGSSQAKFSLGSSTGGTTQVIATSLTSGSYSYYVTASAEYIVFNRLNTAEFYVDNVSVKEVTRDNVPRIDYTGGGCPHILAEPQRTNVFIQNDISTWNGFSSYADETTAPDGTTIDFVNMEDRRIFPTTTISNSTEYTSSIYLKGNKTADVKLRNTAANDTVITLSTEWQRFELTATSVSTVTNALLIDARYGQGMGAAGLEIAIYGGQLEVGSYPTSYIPTSGSTVTRNQDIFTRDGIGSLINSTEGVLFVEMAALSNDGTNRGISLNDGTSSNRLLLYFSAASNQIAVISTGFAGSIIYTLPDETLFNKIAVRYKANDITLWVDGASRGTPITSATIPTFTAFKFDSGSASSPFFGKVKQLQVYDTALTDEQLLQLTGESGTDFYESYAEMASALTYTIQ